MDAGGKAIKCVSARVGESTCRCQRSSGIACFPLRTLRHCSVTAQCHSLPKAPHKRLREGSQEYRRQPRRPLGSALDSYGCRRLLWPESPQNGSGPKSPCKLSELLPCLSKQRPKRQDCSRKFTCKQHPMGGSSSSQLHLLPGI